MDSPVPNLPGTNTLLLEAGAQAFIVEKEQDLAHLVAGNVNMQSISNDTLLAYSQMKHFMDQHKALLSPVRRIPPEILGVIFVYCLPDGDSPPPPRKSEAPLVLSQICRLWRDTAFSLTRLWSSIAITADNLSSYPPISFVETWLNRAGGHPLSISFRHTMPLLQGDNDSTAAADVLRLVLQRIGQCWRFQFGQNDHEYIRPASLSGLLPFEIPPGGAPLLQNLIGYSPGVFQIRDPSDMPRIRSLCWYRGRNIQLFSLSIPWSQLNHLFLSSTSVISCLEILRSSQSLESFSVLLYHPDPSAAVARHGNIIRIEGLRSLRVSGPAEGFGSLIDSLVLPALQNISLEINRILPFQFAPHLLAFLSRSSCPLAELRFQTTYVSEGDLIDYLHCTSASLVRIVLLSTGTLTIRDKVLTMLTYSPSRNRVLCPKLEYMHLYCCIYSSDGLLADMVESRCIHSSHIARLRRIYVRLTPGLHRQADEQRLSALSSAGLMPIMKWDNPRSGQDPPSEIPSWPPIDGVPLSL